jgi:hypothetical protein
VSVYSAIDSELIAHGKPEASKPGSYKVFEPSSIPTFHPYY